jgi:Flp pilus assembly protein TadG
VRLNLRSSSGNAILEFIAFGVLVFVPLASFAATTSNNWVAKQEAQNVALQLARAYAIDQTSYLEILDRFRSAYAGLEVSTTLTSCCVVVQVVRSGQKGSARQAM